MYNRKGFFMEEEYLHYAETTYLGESGITHSCRDAIIAIYNGTGILGREIR
jgi:hypothetical protein